MEGAAQIALPVLGIAAVAAVTFYAVSFMELREVRAEANLSHLIQPASFLPFGFFLAVNVSMLIVGRNLSESWRTPRRKKAWAGSDRPPAPGSGGLEEKPRKKPGNDRS
ncbi:unnamed protein product, partial [Musa acuminata var. zebrina]